MTGQIPVEQEPFGMLDDGGEVSVFVIAHAQGLKAKFSPCGECGNLSIPEVESRGVYHQTCIYAFGI